MNVGCLKDSITFNGSCPLTSSSAGGITVPSPLSNKKGFTPNTLEYNSASNSATLALNNSLALTFLPKVALLYAFTNVYMEYKSEKESFFKSETTCFFLTIFLLILLSLNQSYRI